MSRSILAAMLCASVLLGGQPAFADSAPDPAVTLWQAQPGNDGLAVALARRAAEQDDLTKAADYLALCITAPGEHRQARSELGWVRYLQGRLPDALNQLQEAAKTADSLTLGRLAWVLTEAGQRDEAIKAALATRRLKAPEGKPFALLSLGVLASDDARAAEYLKEAMTLSPSPWPHYWLGRRSADAAGRASFIEAYRRGLDSRDVFDHRAFERADTALLQIAEKDAGFRRQWETLLEELVTAHPQDEGLSERLINAYRQNARPEFVIAELRRRLGLAKDKAVPARRIAETYLELGQDQLALEAYERAIKLTGSSKEPAALALRCDKVELLMSLGREADAAAELDKLLADAADFRRAKLLRGLTYALKRDWGQAAKMVAGLEAVTPEERLLVNFVRRQEGKDARWIEIFSGGS